MSGCKSTPSFFNTEDDVDDAVSEDDTIVVGVDEMMRMLLNLQPATATFTPSTVASTRSSTCCRVGKAAASASSVATIRPVGTVTTARRDTIEISANLSVTRRHAEVINYAHFIPAKDYR